MLKMELGRNQNTKFKVGFERTPIKFTILKWELVGSWIWGSSNLNLANLKQSQQQEATKWMNNPESKNECITYLIVAIISKEIEFLSLCLSSFFIVCWVFLSFRGTVGRLDLASLLLHSPDSFVKHNFGWYVNAPSPQARSIKYSIGVGKRHVVFVSTVKLLNDRR